MNRLILFFISSALFSACAAPLEFEERHLSDFEIDGNALQDKQEVEIIYSAPMPDFNNDLEYYVIMVVVTKDSRDTVNLLTISSAIGISENDRVRNFIHPNSNMYEVMISAMLKQDVNEYQPKEITTVMIDAETEQFINPDYPFIIGVLGKVTDGHIQVDMMDKEE